MQSPPFPVFESSAILIYLQKFLDKENLFGFEDELEQSQCLQWLLFWHGIGASSQGRMSHYRPYYAHCISN
jgi:glutathione S-transferase